MGHESRGRMYKGVTFREEGSTEMCEIGREMLYCETGCVDKGQGTEMEGDVLRSMGVEIV